MTDNHLKQKTLKYSSASAAPDILSVYTWPSALNPPAAQQISDTLPFTIILC
jgi:hypothetical protein